jgi:hypothetical protein
MAGVQVAARLTPSDAPHMAGAFVWAYQQATGRPPVRRESWLYPLALSAFETAKWTAMWNYNAGNVTTATHNWYLNPHVTTDLKFQAFNSIGDGALGEVAWLNTHGAIAAADAADYNGFMQALQTGCYAGCVAYPSLQATITSLLGVTPIAYPPGMSTAAWVATALLAAGGAAFIYTELYGVPRWAHVPRWAQRNRPVRWVRKLFA